MPKRYNADTIDRMIELYRQGNSIRMIAAKLNASYGGVHRALITRTELRSRSEAAVILAQRLKQAKARDAE